MLGSRNKIYQWLNDIGRLQTHVDYIRLSARNSLKVTCIDRQLKNIGEYRDPIDIKRGYSNLNNINNDNSLPINADRKISIYCFIFLTSSVVFML